MKHFIILILSALLIIQGCSKTSVVPDVNTDPAGKSTVIPLEKALSDLNNFLRNNYSHTKSGVQKIYSMSDVKVFGKKNMPVATKADGTSVSFPDTLVYAVNFDDGGYALLSANTVLKEGVLCITDDGIIRDDFLDANPVSYPVSDESSSDTASVYYGTEDRELLDNEGDFEISDIGEDFVGAMVSDAVTYNSMYNYLDEDNDMSSGGNIYTSNDDLTVYGPYVETKWKQRDCFDYYTPNRYSAGCGPVAAGQIIVCNRRSKTMVFDDYKCSWDSLAAVDSYYDISGGGVEARDQAGHFIAFVGNGDNCKAKYSSGGTTVKAKNVQETFRHFGYLNVRRYTGFGHKNRERAKRQLRAGKPVYLSACKSWSLKGHCFVLDGLLEDNTTSTHYVHINWGWNGKNDGYFRFDMIAPNSIVARDPVIDSNCSVDSIDDKYTWYFRMITYDL